MIDISSYMQRLEWLKEWMGYRVDYAVPVIKVLNKYVEVKNGILFLTDMNGKFISFDDYCIYRQSLSKTII